MSSDSQPVLYRLSECPQLMADACLCDESQTLIFLSVWGRDTAIQEFLARLTLTTGEVRSLQEIRLLDERNVIAAANIGNLDRLQKRTTRAHRRTLFGPMLHLWLFDKRCQAPDRANAAALTVMPRRAPDRIQRLWQLVRETCPLPLLDHWRDCVLEILVRGNMLSELPVALGRLEGYRLSIDVPALTVALGDLICRDGLGIDPSIPLFQRPLQAVA